jgi:hypothetical protein
MSNVAEMVNVNVPGSGCGERDQHAVPKKRGKGVQAIKAAFMSSLVVIVV